MLSVYHDAVKLFLFSEGPHIQKTLRATESPDDEIIVARSYGFAPKPTERAIKEQRGSCIKTTDVTSSDVFFFQAIMTSQLLDVPHKHPSSLWSFTDNALTVAREAVLTAGYVPLATLAEKAVVSYEPLIRTFWFSRSSLPTPQCSTKYHHRPSTNCY